MFGFGLVKLLLTVIAVAAVWYGFKVVARRVSGGGKLDEREPPQSAERRIEAEEMTACPTCGVYVPRDGARACDRDDCPYPA